MSAQLEPPPAPSKKSAGQCLNGILEQVKCQNASDLLLISGAPPTMFANGAWLPVGSDMLSAADVEALLKPVLSDEQRHELMSSRDLDLGMAVPNLGRYRINVHYERGCPAAAIRAIPEVIPPFESLSLPDKVLDFANFASGLVLVTGGTGQGKSTTLAALIDHINRTRSSHIITIEDPVEFAFKHERSLIEQRQVGDDSPSFASALRHVLRQRPDVILIGEMRDLETMAAALTAAETGHLVLTTLHTASASQTLARVIDVFPPAQQPQVRTQLAASLRAILCQTLVPDQAGGGLAPATELLVATSAIRRAIRDNETHLIYSMIETGRRLGMHTLEQSLDQLVQSNRVSPEAAMGVAVDPSRLQRMLARHLPIEAEVAMQAITEGMEDPWLEANNG